LEAADILCGPLLTYPDLIGHPQVTASGMIVPVVHPAAGVQRIAGIPHRLSETPASVRLPPPLVGEHTEEVLREAGFSAVEVASLHEQGIVGAGERTASAAAMGRTY
jgi:crotonobetainyl-CoA:carnitine CoA-transferase CaiB-like acyl-CoA transferase